MIRKFVALDGTEFEVDLAEPGAFESVYFLSVHKAGSTLLHRMVRDICAAGGRPQIELEPAMFRRGVVLDDCPLEAMQLLELKGYVFGGFRAPWMLSFVRQYRTARKLLLVRDPRDIAVSYYFSMSRSHVLPRQGTAREEILKLRETALSQEVSAYVMKGKVNPVINNLKLFIEHSENFENMEVLRYEDVIFDKPLLVDKICDYCAVDLPAEERTRIAAKHDIRPERENPNAHVRQVTPGNYKTHLSEEAQTFLTRRYQRLMTKLGYI
ncbi:sulfotransferase domain-containing protein [Acuticoccus kandeliae]|uniref:sulfotransferase domain-containing protein n=1 Tax=Acuticoccus kandeliae TaxID=2073160 RepID=UPI001300A799|nr:sulfotransferase domain-containing protein [Acuticoccus kandeliae]